MRVLVGPHKIEIVKDEPVNEREININECYFEFDERIPRDFVKDVYFTFEGKTYKMTAIIDNKCNIPHEVLERPGDIELGVVAYKIASDGKETRFNPSPTWFNTWDGSLKDKAENSKPITPSEYEQFEEKLNEGLLKIEDKIIETNEKLVEVDNALDDVDQALIETDKAIELTNNLDLDAVKEEKKTTVTITKKDKTKKIVEILDGEKGEKGDVGDFNFATFEIDISTGELIANKTENLELIDFAINKNGFLEVII
ncbi:MAG: hypothetical protein KBT03_03725 [Bacteroidales bacterium]|nr:hypothetical protein [Candidatus Scybalousia scybalohippi]